MRAAAAIEATPDLGEAERDERDQQAAEYDDDGAVVADENLDSRRQPQDPRTDRQVDRKGGERPAADPASQPAVSMELRNRDRFAMLE